MSHFQPRIAGTNFHEWGEVEMRRVWISKGVRPEVRRQTRYEWDYLYGALEVVEGRAEFLHLPTVNLDCNQLFLEHLRSSDPQAHHVVIADQASFHLREGEPSGRQLF